MLLRFGDEFAERPSPHWAPPLPLAYSTAAEDGTRYEDALDQALPDHLGQFGEDIVAIAFVLDSELRLTGNEIEVKIDFSLVLPGENLGSVPFSGTAAETASRGADGRWSEKCYIEF